MIDVKTIIETILILLLIAYPLIALLRRLKPEPGETYIFETPRDAWEYGKDRVFGE
jgi:hypothetical protein